MVRDQPTLFWTLIFICWLMEMLKPAPMISSAAAEVGQDVTIKRLFCQRLHLHVVPFWNISTVCTVYHVALIHHLIKSFKSSYSLISEGLVSHNVLFSLIGESAFDEQRVINVYSWGQSVRTIRYITASELLCKELMDGWMDDRRMGGWMDDG